MTVLNTEKIRERLKESSLENRLVITPILDPSSQLKKGDASIDVRLGRAFSVPRPWNYSQMEDVSSGLLQTPAVEQIVLDYGQPFVLHPHQFVLARTLEVVRLPRDLMAYVVERSSWGRRGLTVATATAVHPEFYGPITLELKNVGEVPISLYTFDRVAQLVFHVVETTKPEDKGDQAAGSGASPLEQSKTSSAGGVESAIVEPESNDSERQVMSGENEDSDIRQFAFGFIPELGQARDRATLQRIALLAKKRLEATRKSAKRPPPHVASGTKGTPQKS